MDQDDLRPPVWIGHVIMQTDRLPETAAFMRRLGMRPIVERPEVAVLELRGGTHLVLLARPEITAGEAAFDLMVEDLHAKHAEFVALGFAPTAIEKVSPEHEAFKVTEPSGQVIKFYSNHVSGEPV